MTTNYHTVITIGAAADAGTFNSPLGEMDAILGNHTHAANSAGSPIAIDGIAASAVSASNIDGLTITGAELATGAVTIGKCAAGAISGSDLNDDVLGGNMSLDGASGSVFGFAKNVPGSTGCVVTDSVTNVVSLWYAVQNVAAGTDAYGTTYHMGKPGSGSYSATTGSIRIELHSSGSFIITNVGVSASNVVAYALAW